MTERSFRDLRISICGFFGAHKQRKWKELIETLGATFSEKVTTESTHLITTVREVRNNSAKVVKAYDAYNCETVSLQWLLDSQVAGEPLPEEQYTVTGKEVDKGNEDDKSAGTIAGLKRRLEEVLGVEELTSSKRARAELRVDREQVTVPADVTCPFRDEYSVYIDIVGTIWDAMLVRSAAGGKSNHFYHQQILVDKKRTLYRIWVRWGRIGELPHSHDIEHQSELEATRAFRAKFRAKTGRHWLLRFEDGPQNGKYRYIGLRCVDIDKNGNVVQLKQLPPTSRISKCLISRQVQQLLSIITGKPETASPVSLDARMIPLGQLGRATILEGYLVLKELSELIAEGPSSYTNHSSLVPAVITHMSTQYLSIIPHIFGKNKPPVLCTEKHIKKELELLLELAGARVSNYAKEAIATQSFLSQRFQNFGLDELTPLRHESPEFQRLAEYCYDSNSNGYPTFKILEIFRIRRTGEETRFKSAYANLSKSDRRLLWHGSRTMNFARILAEGLKVQPKGVPQNGSALGKGIYFADVASRSFGYCSTARPEDTGLLLLCDVELGTITANLDKNTKRKVHGPMTAMCEEPGRPGYLWSDAGCIHARLTGAKIPALVPSVFYSDSMYAVSNPAQVRMRYLFLVQRM